MKKTEWYPDHVRPAYIGVYEVRIKMQYPKTAYQYWTGQYWGLVRPTPASAMLGKSRQSLYQPSPRWRGLAQKPE